MLGWQIRAAQGSFMFFLRFGEQNESIFKIFLGSVFWVPIQITTYLCNTRYLRLLIWLYVSILGTMECSFYFVLKIAVMRGKRICMRVMIVLFSWWCKYLGHCNILT